MGLSGCIFNTCLLTLWLLGPSRVLVHPGCGQAQDLAGAGGRFGWPRGARFIFLLCGSSMSLTEDSVVSITMVVGSGGIGCDDGCEKGDEIKEPSCVCCDEAAYSWAANMAVRMRREWEADSAEWWQRGE
jgi:hypothetical protein